MFQNKYASETWCVVLIIFMTMQKVLVNAAHITHGGYGSLIIILIFCIVMLSGIDLRIVKWNESHCESSSAVINSC